MILNNAHLITQWSQKPLVEGALLAIEGKTIVDFDRMGKLIDRYDDPETYDVGGRLVVPGTIDALARPLRSLTVGMAEGPGSFTDALDRESIYLGVLIGLMDSLRAGVTSVFAMLPGSSSNEAGLEIAARAFASVGMRGASAYAVSHADEIPSVALETQARLGAASEVFTPLSGLELTPGLDDDAIRAWADAAAGLGALAHISVPGGREGLDTSLSMHAASPVARLAKLGVLDRLDYVIFAPHRLPADAEIVRASGGYLVHCPEFEMLDRAPLPELTHLRAAEVPVVFGSNGAGRSMLRQFRFAATREQGNGVDFASAVRIARRGAFQTAGEMASRHFGITLGCIRPGARADLVVLDRIPSTPLSADNVPEHLFAACETARVHTVIVNGAILYHNGSFVGLDEARLRARAREISRLLWERIKQ